MHGCRLAGGLCAGALIVWLLGFGSTLQAEGQSQVSVSTGKACDGLSQQECCAQTLKTHAFRAVGERLPKRGRLVVDLACKQPKQRKLPATSCRSLLVARGFGVGDANEVCRASGLQRRCKERKTCRECVSAMRKLGYRAAAPACLAATRVAAGASGRGRVVLHADERDVDGVEITRRRTLVR